MSASSSVAATPVDIVVHSKSRVLQIDYANGRSHRLSFEFLRVHSPSAEVRGHGPGQEVLQSGKRNVFIDSIEPVGHYAIQPRFSDGHDTGLFAWDYLYWLGENESRLWRDYLDRLEAAGQSRGDEAASVSAGAPNATIEVRSISRPRPPGGQGGAA